MIGSQYKIELADDYDMNTIEKRIRENGFKTDGFRGLHTKFYMMSRKSAYGMSKNTYCPLYLWNDSEGLNDFLFGGYYDNILNTFGWQKVNLGIPLMYKFEENIGSVKYAFEQIVDIKESKSLANLTHTIKESLLSEQFDNYLVIYNSDKWKYVVFYFSEEYTDIELTHANVYEIKHISFG